MPKTSCTFLTVKVCSEVQQDKSLKVEKAALHEGTAIRVNLILKTYIRKMNMC